MTEELKPCPFCGGKAIINDVRSGGGVQACIITIKCQGCKVNMSGAAPIKDGDSFHAEMARRWNRRVD